MLVYVVFPLWWFEGMVEINLNFRPFCNTLENFMVCAYMMLCAAGCKNEMILICLFNFVMTVIWMCAHSTLKHCTHIKSNLFDHLKTHLVMNFWNHKSNMKRNKMQMQKDQKPNETRKKNSRKKKRPALLTSCSYQVWVIQPNNKDIRGFCFIFCTILQLILYLLWIESFWCSLQRTNLLKVGQNMKANHSITAAWLLFNAFSDYTIDPLLWIETKKIRKHYSLFQLHCLKLHRTTHHIHKTTTWNIPFFFYIVPVLLLICRCYGSNNTKRKLRPLIKIQLQMLTVLFL